MRVFPDASSRAWYCRIITQIPKEDADKPIEEQRHEPLAFYGKRWTKAEQAWKIIEQEAAAIVFGLVRGAYLLQAGEEPFELYTDHRNLVYIFNNKDLQKHKQQKLERWALFMQSYHYNILQHIDGERNVWADLLTRWGVAGEIALKARRTRLFCRQLEFEDVRVTPRLHPNFQWPNEDAIRNSQTKLSEEEKQGAEYSNDGLWRNSENKIIIPAEDEDIRARLWVVAHAGAAGHFRQYATLMNLEERFTWKDMSEEVELLCNQCVHCVAVSGGKREPRPWGNTLQARRPYEILCMDYFYVAPIAKKAAHGFKYILVLKDEFSGYVWLIPAAAATSRAAAEAIIRWMADYSCTPQYLVSDRGSHFTAEVLSELTRLMAIEHHLVVAYSPFSNGGVERANRTIKKTLTAMLNAYAQKFQRNFGKFHSRRFCSGCHSQRTSRRQNFVEMERSIQSSESHRHTYIHCIALGYDADQNSAHTTHEKICGPRVGNINVDETACSCTRQ